MDATQQALPGCQQEDAMFTKAKVLGIALGAVLLLGAASAASAADWDCARRIDHEQHELDRAIAHHGYYSPQADHERRELARVRYECRVR
jgi:hypothetical protein